MKRLGPFDPNDRATEEDNQAARPGYFTLGQDVRCDRSLALNFDFMQSISLVAYEPSLYKQDLLI
jgi:hypothetical protein